MQGYLLTLYTAQNRRHHGKPLAEWLLEEARRLGVRGATIVAAAEGFGGHGRVHAAHFFELADQPVEVSMALGEVELGRVMARLREERLEIFYTKTPIEFGTT